MTIPEPTVRRDRKANMDFTRQVSCCVDLIRRADSVGALTGAGISTSAGIPDFRGPQGLYITRRYDPEIVFDFEYFLRDPLPFYRFAKDFIMLEATIQPTPTHRFLARLERAGKLKGICTQNIDALHQRAGSRRVLEIHGSFWQSHCLRCNEPYAFELMKRKILQEDIPRCHCGGVIKPDIVFFGEAVKFLDDAFKLAMTSDLFLVIGTSCVVYPAAMVPHYCQGGIILVNKGECRLDTSNIVLNVEADLDEFFIRVGEKLR